MTSDLLDCLAAGVSSRSAHDVTVPFAMDVFPAEKACPRRTPSVVGLAKLELVLWGYAVPATASIDCVLSVDLFGLGLPKGNTAKMG